MRKVLIITGILGMMYNLNAQSIIDKLYDKYSGSEGFVTVYISKYMFDMFRNSEVTVGSDETMDQLISRLNCIKVLMTDDDPATTAPVNLYQEIMKVLPSSSYKQIMVVREKDQDLTFYVKEEKNRVAELLLITGGSTSNALISIQGDIDMKNI